MEEILKLSSSFFFQIQYAARKSYKALRQLFSALWQSPRLVSMPQSLDLKVRPSVKRVRASLNLDCRQRKMPISLQVRLIWSRRVPSRFLSSMCLLASYRSERASSYSSLLRWMYALRMRNQVWQGCISSPFLTFSLHFSTLWSIRSYFASLQIFSSSGVIICMKRTTSGLVLSILYAFQNSRQPFSFSLMLQQIRAWRTTKSASFSLVVMQFSISLRANCRWLTYKQAKQLSRQSPTVLRSCTLRIMRLWKAGQRLKKASNSVSSRMFLMLPVSISCSPWTFDRNFTFSMACEFLLRSKVLRQKRMALDVSQFFQQIQASYSMNWGYSRRKSTLWQASMASGQRSSRFRSRARASLSARLSLTTLSLEVCFMIQNYGDVKNGRINRGRQMCLFLAYPAISSLTYLLSFGGCEIINIMQAFRFLLLIAALLSPSLCSPSNPTWFSTSTVKTATNTLFSTLRLQGTSQEFVISFSSSFPSTPLVAYGIEQYRGTDFLIQQEFRMWITTLDPVQFYVKLNLTSITNVLLLSISYMAVDSTNFNYYFNAFTEVKLNYQSSLSNFSAPSGALKYHYEVVDYTYDQNINGIGLSPGSIYDSFSAPYTQYKIALFLTSMSLFCVSNSSIYFDITAGVIDANSYYMNATLGYNATVNWLEFSQVFYDPTNFSVANERYLYFQELVVTNTAVTTFWEYSNTLTNNFMMGLKSFTASSGLCSFEYQWINTAIAGNNGAQLQISTAFNTSCGFSGHVSTILLMMRWNCPASYPNLDFTIQKCVPSCSPYQYLNGTDYNCYSCTNTRCYTCNPSNPNNCLSCAANYQLVNNTCLCDTSLSAYLEVGGQCVSCGSQVSQCTMCSYLGNASAAYSSANFMCVTCNATNGYFIDPSNLCQTCSVAHCTTCIGYSTCSVCDSGYGVTSIGTCSTCPIDGCQTCTNLTACATCQTGYMKINNLCYTCPTSCTCGGYTLPKYSNGDCSTICGDGIVIFPYEGCDDGNTADGDGCSSSCQVESLSSCSGQPSTCYYTSTLAAALINSAVSSSSCNVITVNFQVTPSLALLSNPSINWTAALSLQTTSVLSGTISSSYSNGIISQTFSFNKNIQDTSLTFKLNPSLLLSSTYLFYTAASTLTFTVVPSNNIPAVYLSESVCNSIKTTQSFAIAQESVSYLGLLLSTMSCKIVGLEMFGVLQLSYFSLSNYDYVPPALLGLLQRKEVNGVNVKTSSPSSELIPSRVSTNGYSSSDFLANFNVMLLVTCLIAATGGVLYMATYLLNKQSMDEQMSEARESLKSAEHSQRGEQKPEETRSQFWHRMSKYILKQVLLTFIIFNMLNIGFSAGLQIKYIDQVDSFSIICLLVTLSGVIAVALAQVVTGKEQFGEYIDKFKQDRLQSKYMIATIIYRFTLGFLLAVINEWIASGMVYLSVSAAFLSYICYCEPFNDQFQNHRSKFIHSIHILILFVNFYYRLEANASPTEASQLAVPAYIQIAAVAVSVFGSSILLGYEFYLKVKGMFSKPQGANAEAKEQIIQQETIHVIEG